MLADEGKYVLAKTQTSEICPEIRSEQRTYIVYLRSPQKMLVNREGENRECWWIHWWSLAKMLAVLKCTFHVKEHTENAASKRKIHHTMKKLRTFFPLYKVTQQSTPVYKGTNEIFTTA